MDMQIAKWCLGMLAACGLLFGAARADAAVSVTDVTAKQRYPWNGLVDIRCTVSGIEEGLNWMLVAEAVEPDTGEVHGLSHFRVVRDGTNSENRLVNADGEYELLWDARADLGEVVCSNMVVQVSFDEHPLVQLWEGGPYWADRNVGAEEASDYGYHFWWGDAVGYKWENGQWVATDGSASGFSFEIANVPTYKKSASKLLSEGWITTNNMLAPDHDPAQAQWGRGWRMPTGGELSGLREKCDRTWVTTNGVNGFLVRGRDGYASASIFLPAAGWGNKAEWARDGVYGYLLAGDPLTDGTTRSYRIIFRAQQFTFDQYYDRFVGSSCRPVWGEAD